MPVQEDARKLAELFYAEDATVFYQHTATELSVESLKEWIYGTIDMINNGECDEFTLSDMEEALLYVHEIVAVVHSW